MESKVFLGAVPGLRGDRLTSGALALRQSGSVNQMLSPLGNALHQARRLDGSTARATAAWHSHDLYFAFSPAFAWLFSVTFSRSFVLAHLPLGPPGEGPCQTSFGGFHLAEALPLLHLSQPFQLSGFAHRAPAQSRVLKTDSGR